MQQAFADFGDVCGGCPVVLDWHKTAQVVGVEQGVGFLLQGK
jgi:hypothetical protein